MCDCVQSSLTVPNGGTKFRNLGQLGCNSKLVFLPLPRVTIGSSDCSALAKRTVLNIEHVKNLVVFGKSEKPLMNVKVCSGLGVFDSNGFDFSSELGLKEGEDEKFELGLRNGGDKLTDFIRENDRDDLGLKNLKREKQQHPKYKGLRDDKGGLKGEDLIGIGSGKNEELKAKEVVQPQPKGKQLMKRSSLLAKQVIGIQSALSFGFVSQLWVDTTTWVVLEVEVRPNLLSSEAGKFRLEDIKQIGDVVLVPDERLMLNEFRTVRLETLVSTYALSTGDVLKVVSDTIIVHEAAASHIQRLTKGFLGTKSIGISSSNLKYSNLEESGRPIKGQKPGRKSSKRKSYREVSGFVDDLELPMDYM